MLYMQLWQYEGSKTLAHYLRRRDCNQRLVEDLRVPESQIVPTVMQHVFESLAVSSQHVLISQEDSTSTCPFLALAMTIKKLNIPLRHVACVSAKWLQCMPCLQQPGLALLSKRLSRHILAISLSHSWCGKWSVLILSKKHFMRWYFFCRACTLLAWCTEMWSLSTLSLLRSSDASSSSTLELVQTSEQAPIMCLMSQSLTLSMHRLSRSEDSLGALPHGMGNNLKSERLKEGDFLIQVN